MLTARGMLATNLANGVPTIASRFSSSPGVFTKWCGCVSHRGPGVSKGEPRPMVASGGGALVADALEIANTPRLQVFEANTD